MKQTNQNKRLLAILSILLVVSFLVTSLVSYFVSVSSMRDQIVSNTLPLTGNTIYSEIQRDLLKPVFISSLMANDTFLKRWILAGEVDETQITEYLKEIKLKYKTFSSFLVSEKTKRYYYEDGILKEVRPDVPRDAWYFRVRDMAPHYEINVDIDMANEDALTVFVNYKIHDDEGNYIGATGVGLMIDSVVDLMERYSQEFRRGIYFVDTDGRIVLRSRAIASHVATMDELDGMGEISDEILRNEGASFRVRRDSGLVHLNTRFIPELGWYLVVEQEENRMTAAIFEALILNLVLCAIITLIVLFLTYVSIGAYQKQIDGMFASERALRQIGVEQQEEISKKHDALEEKNRALEEALNEVNTLTGLLPICASCKRIREEEGYWKQVEVYVSERSEAKFTHGICPDCTKALYPEFTEDS